jgi:hypothetical protein
MYAWKDVRTVQAREDDRLTINGANRTRPQRGILWKDERFTDGVVLDEIPQVDGSLVKLP